MESRTERQIVLSNERRVKFLPKIGRSIMATLVFSTGNFIEVGMKDINIFLFGFDQQAYTPSSTYKYKNGKERKSNEEKGVKGHLGRKVMFFLI